tara:strand:- start:300 stop:1058 length:759 start_codon:yes stop_codon:yes gene_type:complete
MTKHNALRMFGRSGNPTLSDATFAGFETTGAKTMSLQGTVNKVGILLALVIGGALFTWNQFYSTGSAGFLMPVGLFGGMIFAVITMFRPTLAMYTAPIYAILQGLFLGGISAAFESMYPGIVIQATGLTFGTLASLLVLYKTGVIKPTENFRLMIVSATMGIAVLYAISFVMSLFGSGIGFIHSNGLFGIGFSLFVVGIAAMNLVLDFDFIEDGAERGAPRYMEWFGAFALMVTLIWLYLEMLRLLAKIRSR